MWWPPPPTKTWNWLAIFIVKVRKNQKVCNNITQNPNLENKSNWNQIENNLLLYLLLAIISKNKQSHTFVVDIFICVTLLSSNFDTHFKRIGICLLSYCHVVLCSIHVWISLSCCLASHVCIVPWNWTCMIHAVEALEEYQSNMGQ
jgi:hypothetical protein